MDYQPTFAELEYEHKKRKTRREKFLEQMDALIPWAELERLVARCYRKHRIGRKPYPVSVMLRIHMMQLFWNLSDPAMEDHLYEVESMRRFAGLRLNGPIPDETTILNFRRQIEKCNLGPRILQTVNDVLSRKGLMLRSGTIMDATIIEAPSSTKNKEKKRDEEMHQTKKGNQWHFGMKMHVGVDDVTGLVHSIETTPANEHDLNVSDKLLHGQEKRVWADAGYCGIHKREEHKSRNVSWLIAARPGKRRKMTPEEQEAERMLAGHRAKVEHVFFWIKRKFGYSKTRYRGLAKNTSRLCVLSALANLMIARRFLSPT
ncbi:MAG: IS5 family transposase [Gammaproteobacteria bacterium]|nr:MAG: IS5 family transposase [Gammaproteobacteria bacterium]